ncbi:hypothetical protein [Hydrogenobacter hydrogenophilus]|uniref:YbbR-like protein n=1 Tax=Hydrogenobacter hydrogenophilus TaxID=35835 RepID=A0A285NR43_9AQUI|nr:hypothetical protein [Hydrogenobacter hydrogenophilus]SNZ11994.1 hypothetical protein SAMN06265353_0387 [Hydrogenobacter hydrogenophilus]
MLKRVILNNWQYKLLALFIGFSLWLVVNLGVRVPIVVERSIEVINEDPNYTYKLERKRVRIKLLVIERLSLNESIEGVKAQVDVKGLGEGEYVLKVHVESPFKVFVYPSSVEPEYVKVYVRRKPPQGR